MTSVSGVMLRGLSGETFDRLALLTGDPAPPERDYASGVTTLTFAASLTLEQQAAVLDLMTSRDDADMAARQLLIDAQAALDALAVADDFQAAVHAVLKALTPFVLGRPDLT